MFIDASILLLKFGAKVTKRSSDDAEGPAEEQAWSRTSGSGHSDYSMAAKAASYDPAILAI